MYKMDRQEKIMIEGVVKMLTFCHFDVFLWTGHQDELCPTWALEATPQQQNYLPNKGIKHNI